MKNYSNSPPGPAVSSNYLWLILLDIYGVPQVPIVVVFTKFDILISRMEERLSGKEMEMPDEQVNQLCIQKAQAEFKKLCVDPLERLDPALHHATTSGSTFSDSLINLVG
jgi:hypothetical protein